jgi:hypothetical protein
VPSSNSLRDEIVSIGLGVLKKCLLIAPLEAHATVGRLAAIASTGFQLHVVDVSGNSLRFKLDQYPFTEIKSYKHLNTSLNCSPFLRIFHKVVRKLRSFDFFKESRSLLRSLEEEIERVKPELVVTYYGPLGVHYAKLVKIINRNLPVVSILNLIPSSLDYRNTIPGHFSKYLNDELNNYKSTIQKLDFLVCASPEMREYLAKKYVINHNRMAVLPDYFPRTMTFKSLKADIEHPELSLIFLGAPERWGGTLDNIDEQLLELALSGFFVYSGKLADFVVSTNNAFRYPFFSDEEVFSGELSTFAHQFQASLITYGIDKRHQRFKTTLPTRFFNAISAGIPIAVRAGLFDAVESYVERFAIGFSFRNVEDLKIKLMDHDTIKIYRSNAVEHSRNFYAEVQAEEFKRIFEFAVSNRKEV